MVDLLRRPKGPAGPPEAPLGGAATLRAPTGVPPRGVERLAADLQLPGFKGSFAILKPVQLDDVAKQNG